MGSEMKAPLTAKAETSLERPLFIPLSLSYLHHLAFEPHEPASFCLRIRHGLVWDEGRFCFILLYKQKHSLISLLKG